MYTAININLYNYMYVCILLLTLTFSIHEASWEQYRQVFDAIMLSNGWNDAIAALQLLSHLEGDALNVALLVPASRRASRVGLVDALSAHYGSPGQLADSRRQSKKTTRTAGEDPSIFVIELETLAMKTFGDMGQMARLRLFRDRFIAGQDSCELRRHLDSVSPETPIRDIVDRCRVWESHADWEDQRVGGGLGRAHPIYTINDGARGGGGGVGDDPVIPVAQELLESLLQRLLHTAVVAPPKVTPIPSELELLLQRLLVDMTYWCSRPRRGSQALPRWKYCYRICYRSVLLRWSGLPRQRDAGTSLPCCVARVARRVMRPLGVLPWMFRFRSCYRGGGRKRWEAVMLCGHPGFWR